MYELLLMIIAYIVFMLVAMKKNAWGWIVLYWALLFIRNGSVVGGMF